MAPAKNRHKVDTEGFKGQHLNYKVQGNSSDVVSGDLGFKIEKIER